MNTIQLHTVKVKNYITPKELECINEKILDFHNNMSSRTSLGSEYLGWLDYPTQYYDRDLAFILEIAKEIRENAQLFIVIGIGGTYLGARAILDALQPYFQTSSDTPKVIFAGQNMSGQYMKQLLDYIEDKEVYINVISKSGTTTEPAIAFRILRQQLEKNTDKMLISILSLQQIKKKVLYIN